MSECVLLLCPLDMSRWITSGRIRPLWFSHPVSEETTQTLMHSHTLVLACVNSLQYVSGCFSYRPIEVFLKRAARLLVALFSSLLLSFRLQLVYGLWQSLQPQCVLIFTACMEVCVYVLLSAPLYCPTSVQIRAFVSWGRQKYKNKAFLPEHWSKHTHIHTYGPCAHREHYESLRRVAQRALLQQNPKKLSSLNSNRNLQMVRETCVAHRKNGLIKKKHNKWLYSSLHIRNKPIKSLV